MTVEIGGDTSKLGKAVKEAEDQSRALSRELKDVNKLLKEPDANAVELLAQKQAILTEQVAATKEKLDTLNAAEASVIAQFERGEITEEQMRAFQREIIYTENAMKGYEKAIAQTGRQLDEARAAQDGQADSLGVLRAKTRQQEQALETLKDQYKTAVIAEGENSESAKGLARQIGTLSGELTENRKRLEEADKAADAFDHTVDEASDDSGKASRQVNALGSAARDAKTGLSTAAVALGTFMGNIALDVLEAAADQLAAIGKGAVETGMSFEAAMSQVAATQGLSISDIQNNTAGAAYTMDLLTDKAREMGAETSFSAAEAAEGLNVLLMSGYDAAASVDMVESVLREAEAGGISIAEAASYISGSMKGFTRESANFADSAQASAYYADLIAKGATIAATDVPQLGQALSGVAATANTYGQAADSVIISLLRLAEQGETGSGAATALSAAMKNLYSPTDTARKALDQLGISAYDAQGEARDFNQIVGELEAALSSLTGEERASLEDAIFGIQGQAAFDKMVVTSGDKLQAFYDGIAGAAGSASLQSETMLDNLQGDLTKLGSAYSDLEISIYNGASLPIRRVVQDITEEMLPAVNALVQGTDGAEAQVGAAFGNLASRLLTELTGLLPAASGVIGNLAVTLIRQLPVILSGLRDAWHVVVGEIASLLPEAFPIIGEALESLLPLLIDMLTQDIPGLIMLICDLLDRGIPAISQAGISLLEAILTAIPQVIRELTKQLPKMIQAILGVLVTAAPELLDAATGMFLAIVEALPYILAALANAAPDLVAAVTDVLLSSESQSAMMDAGFTLITALLDRLPEIIAQLVTAVALMLTRILTTIAERYPEMQEKGRELFLQLIAHAADVIRRLNDFGTRLILSLIAAIRSKFGDLQKSGMELFDTILNGISMRLNSIKDAGRNLVRGLWEGMQAMKDWINGKIADFCSSIISGILDHFAIHSPSRKTAYAGRMLDEGLAEGLEDSAQEPQLAMRRMAEDLLDAAYTLPDLLRTGQPVPAAVPAPAVPADGELTARLDRILSAIERGQVLMLDGDKVVGGTIGRVNTGLSQLQAIQARSGEY